MLMHIERRDAVDFGAGAIKHDVEPAHLDVPLPC